MSKRTVLDYDDVFVRGENSPRAFVLSDAFRRALLQLTDRLYWSSSWTETLSDEEWAIIDEGQRALIEGDDYMTNGTITLSPVININTSDNVYAGGAGCATPPPWADLPGTCYPIENPPIDNTPPPGGIPLPDDGSIDPGDVAAVNEWRCKVANYAWERIDEWLYRLSGLSVSLFSIAAILFALWALLPLSLTAILGGTMLALAAELMAWSASFEIVDDVLDYASQWWRDRRTYIVCRMYNATSSEGLKNDLVDSWLEDLEAWAESRPWWFTGAMNTLERLTRYLFPANIFFIPWRMIPPAGYVGLVDCAQCNQPGDEEDEATMLNEEWWIIATPPNYTGWWQEANNAGAAVARQDVLAWTHTPLTDLGYHEVSVQWSSAESLLAAMSARHGLNCVSLHGAIFYSLGETPGSDGILVSSPTGGTMGALRDDMGSAIITTDSEEYANNTNYSDAVFEIQDNEAYPWHPVEEAKPYGNGQMNVVKMGWRSQSYGAPGASFAWRHWWLVKVAPETA